MTTTLINHRLAAMLFCLCGLAGTAVNAQRRDVPMTPDRWEPFGKVEFTTHKEAQAVVVGDGAAKLKDLTFRDGTIEFEVDPAAMGAGLGFRMRDIENFEMLYFRPQPDCDKEPDCVQYAPFTRNVLLWDMYPQYQSAAPLRPGDWNHVKVVVSGRRMRLFVNGAATPSLTIGSLEGDVTEGQLALIGPGAFRNFSVTSGDVGGLEPGAEPDPAAADTRIVRQWEIAPPVPLAEGAEPAIAGLPTASAGWRALSAERGGLVNVSRLYGYPHGRSARSLTWLKTTIQSDTSQSKPAAIGWAREVWVFVNGRLAYTDKNLYQPPTARKSPDGRLSLQNGSFVLPLKAGDNEVAVAVANNFYGWGLILRLDDLEGIRLARK